MPTQAVLAIDGMSCQMCVRHVTRALSELPGVQVRDVAVGSATIYFDPTESSEQEILQAIREAGYSASRTD